MVQSRTRVQTQLEEVRNWLEHNQANYVTEESVSSHSPKVDVLVTSPFPLAIEVIDNASTQRHSAARKAKRLLSQRIAIAERFGPYLPFVIITSLPSDEVELRTFSSCADAVFSINHLPAFCDLPVLVRLNPYTQQIIQHGQPKNVSISEPQTILSMWENSLSLDAMLTAHSFPEATIAERLRQFLQTQAEQVRREDIPSAVRSREGSHPYLRSNAETLFRNRRVAREFDAVLYDEIKQRLGGEFVPHRALLPTPEAELNFDMPVWQSPHGYQSALRRMANNAIAGSAFHKAQELFADAWILRAYDPHPPQSFILLLGQLTTSSYRTIRGEKQLQAVDVKAINAFEAGGWRVFPWDFAEEVPSFIKYLSDRSQHGDA